MASDKVWVVVANNAEAKIYRVSKFPKLEEVAVMRNTQSRLRDHELVSDRQGRNFSSVGTRRHSYEPKTDPQDHEFDKFARMVARQLHKAFEGGEYGRLYLFCSPEFLGILRPYLNGRLPIRGEYTKDLVKQDIGKIEHQLTAVV